RNSTAREREVESRASTREFLAIVGGVPRLVLAEAKAVEIGLVAEEVACLANGGQRLRRGLLWIAGARSDDEQVAAHGRDLQPGTSTREKYGARSSAFSASGMAWPPSIVPRST